MQLGLGTLISKAGVIESPALVTNTKSLDFDGSDDYLQDTTNGMDNYAEGNPFSISAWIRPGDVSGAQTIACWGKSINSRWFGLVGDYPNVSCYEGGDFSTPIGNQSANMFNSAEIGRIGRTGGESDQKPFNGNIDEVAFWTSELSADEVQQIYDNGTGGTHLDLTVNSVKYTSSSNLNGWIRCGDVSGPYVIQNSAVTPESNLLPDNGVNATNWSEAQAHNGVAGSDLVISQVGSTLKLSQEGASAGFAYHNIITLDSSSTYIVTFNQSGGSVAQMNVRAYKNWPAITSMYVGGSVYFGPGLDEYNFEFVTGGSGTTLSLVFGNIGNGKSLILSEIKVQKVSRGPLFMGSMTATNIKSEVP